MKLFVNFVLLALSELISACGEDTYGGSNSNTEKMEIRNFQVNGTSPGNAVVPLANGADFTVSWLLFSTDPYHVELWLSDTQTTAGAVNFYSVDCGSGDTHDCNNGLQANFTCRYSVNAGNNTVLSCLTDAGQVITNFNNRDAYLLFYACDNLETNCKTLAVNVNIAVN